MWAAGVPRRWGYDIPGTGLWLTERVPYVGGRHEVVQNVALVERVIRGEAPGDGPKIAVDREMGQPRLLPPAPVRVENQVIERWLAEPRRAIIHPGTGAANKLWTIGGWASVIDRLASEGWGVGLTGSPGEKALCEAIAGSAVSSTHNLAGMTADLGQLGWILAQAGMVLGVDSGPLHLAAALDRPTLHLYGPSDEAVWGPWGDPNLHRAFRAPGTRPTMLLDVLSHELEGGPEMRAITPEMVLEQVRELERQAIGC